VHRLARLGEAVARERLAPLRVVLQGRHDLRRRLREDLVEQAKMIRMDVVLEQGLAVLLEP
jgi:hypothetical protein